MWKCRCGNCQNMADNPYSRYPVYENDVDNIVGILHIKDVFKSLLACRKEKRFRMLCENLIMFRKPRISVISFGK